MDPLKRNVGVAFGSLLASSATLVCCVLPAVMVSLGAGAALVGLVSAFPQLVWLSEHKGWVFGIAGAVAGRAAARCCGMRDRCPARRIRPRRALAPGCDESAPRSTWSRWGATRSAHCLRLRYPASLDMTLHAAIPVAPPWPMPFATPLACGVRDYPITLDKLLGQLPDEARKSS